MFKFFFFFFMCDSEKPSQKPKIVSVELKEMLICVDQGTHTSDDSLLPQSVSWFMLHFVSCCLCLSLQHTLLCSSLSKHVCGEFIRMHLVTQMSHTSSGLHASPSGWMNERAERLARGRASWQRRRGLCLLLNAIRTALVCCRRVSPFYIWPA